MEKRDEEFKKLVAEQERFKDTLDLKEVNLRLKEDRLAEKHADLTSKCEELKALCRKILEDMRDGNIRLQYLPLRITFCSYLATEFKTG